MIYIHVYDLQNDIIKPLPPEMIFLGTLEIGEIGSIAKLHLVQLRGRERDMDWGSRREQQGENMGLGKETERESYRGK